MKPNEVPPYYSMGKIRVIDFIVDQRLGFRAGNVVKYLCRFRHKGTPLSDLRKARSYLDFLIKEEEDHESRTGKVIPNPGLVPIQDSEAATYEVTDATPNDEELQHPNENERWP
jgi:hypothetical protein